RYGDNKSDRLPELARELVDRKVDVLVATTDGPIAAAKRETRTIPIVMTNSTDPVGTGFVASLARPGANVTGMSNISADLSAKRLELLRELVPGLTRVAFLWNPDSRGTVLDYRESEAAASSLHLELQSIEVTSVADLDHAFSVLTTQRAQVLLVPTRQSHRVLETGRDRRLRTAESTPLHVWTEGICRRRRPHVVWAERGLRL